MSNYLYNGVELPALPDYDKETHPYAMLIWNAKSGADLGVTLVLSTTPLKYEYRLFQDYLYGVGAGSTIGYEYYAVDGDTDFRASERLSDDYADGELVSLGTILGAPRWANYDVYKRDGTTLQIEASYPIDAETGEEIHDYEIGGEPEQPETPETVLAWQKNDAYKPNTEWDGQTFYKVIGNKWVKHDAVVPAE